MHCMIRTTVLGLALMGSGPVIAADANVQTLGNRLLNELWTSLASGDVISAGRIIGDGFQSVHEDGARDRAGELALIKGLHMDGYDIDSARFTRNGTVLVATYRVTVHETIDGKRLSRAPAMRMSVWVLKGDSWKLMAHANLKALQ